jgi:hypothetical protein
MVGTVNDDSTSPDDSISRIDALALVRGSMSYDEAEAADYLADCARGLLGQGRVEWTSQNEIVIDCVVGPLLQGGNRPQSPGPEQLEQAIRSRLWEQARRGEPGVHVKGDSATYRAAVVCVSAFGGWELESPPEEGVSPSGPEWLVTINFKLIKYRLSQIITVLRVDGGLLEAGLERLRSLGRASTAVAVAINPAPPSDPSPTPESAPASEPKPEPEPVPQQGKTDKPRVKAEQFVVDVLGDVSSKHYSQTGYAEEVLLPRSPGFVLGTLKNALYRIARQKNAGGSSLWKGLPKRRGPSH